MTSSLEKQAASADPYAEPLAGAGKMAVIVPLIIGGALVASVIMLWEAHRQKQQLSEMTKIEEEVRIDLQNAYREVRYFRPQIALGILLGVEAKMQNLKTIWPTDYSDLRVALLLMKAESLYILDAKANAAGSEALFDEALKMMTRASGEMWLGGVLGRAKTRVELGRYHEAEGDLDLVMERNPSFGAAYYWRALARRGQGDETGAAADEERARSLDSWPPARVFWQGALMGSRDMLADDGEDVK